MFKLANTFGRFLVETMLTVILFEIYNDSKAHYTGSIKGTRHDISLHPFKKALDFPRLCQYKYCIFKIRYLPETPAEFMTRKSYL
jgi:hypothetical protein